MAILKEREFGKIPEWAMRGQVSLLNYSYRAEAHCALLANARGHIHPTIKRPSPEFSLWRQYFEEHLGGYNSAIERLLSAEPLQAEMTVPEGEPQWFDPSFEPNARWIERPYVQLGSRPLLRPPIPIGEDYYAMVAKYGIPVEREKLKKLDRLINTPDSETPETVREKLGITPEAWDAMPDARKHA